MSRHIRNSAPSFNDDINVLQQRHRSTQHPLSPQSVLSVLLRSKRQSEDFPHQLGVAQRIAAFLTAEQRRAAGRSAWPERELLAAATGTPLQEIDRLIQNFDQFTEVASRYLRLGFWGRIKQLTREDPLLGSLTRRLRPSGMTASRPDDRR